MELVTIGSLNNRPPTSAKLHLQLVHPFVPRLLDVETHPLEKPQHRTIIEKNLGREPKKPLPLR